MSKIVVAVLVIGVISAAVFYGLKTQQTRDSISSQNFVSTFEECVQARGKVNTTFPRQCESNDGKTYIEKVSEPVNTDKWEAFNEVQGFSFKCPSSWKCQKLNESAVTVY